MFLRISHFFLGLFFLSCFLGVSWISKFFPQVVLSCSQVFLSFSQVFLSFCQVFLGCLTFFLGCSQLFLSLSSFFLGVSQFYLGFPWFFLVISRFSQEFQVCFRCSYGFSDTLRFPKICPVTIQWPAGSEIGHNSDLSL